MSKLRQERILMRPKTNQIQDLQHEIAFNVFCHCHVPQHSISFQKTNLRLDRNGCNLVANNSAEEM